MTNNGDWLLWTALDGEDDLRSNFVLSEFANSSGLAIAHPALMVALESTRRDLNREVAVVHEIRIEITDGVRTHHDLAKLAARLGWTDEGGAVSRTSKHLIEFGGIAADFYAYYIDSTGKKVRLAANVVGPVARHHFDYVKDDYNDGHIHGDMRGVL